MLDYSIYDYKTGRIIQTGTTQPHMIRELPMADGQAVIAQALDPELHYVHQGRAAIRPEMPNVTTDGCGFTFDAVLPDGAEITIISDFIDQTIPASDNTDWALAVPEAAEITVDAPWPYRSLVFRVTDEAHSISNPSLIAPDTDRARIYFMTAVAAQGEQLVDTMLGNPTLKQRDNWKLKRSIRDRYLAGVNTTGDDAAMSEAVRYSGLTAQQELERIGARVEFEDWVVMRAEGIRQETERRLDDASTFQEIATAVGWAEIESANAVAEAQSKLNGE